MMSTVDWTFLLKSPRLPDIAAALNDRLRTESEARLRFYDEMSDDENAEVIDGEIITPSPVRNRHLTATLNLATLLVPYVRQHRLGEVRQENCLCVFPRNDYEPDIVFFDVEKSAGFTSETMKFPIPDFIVEVLSDSTAARDRGVKFEDVEGHGVHEYWIIDAETETIEQYVVKDGAFQLLLKSGSGHIASTTIAGFQIPIRAVFDAEENLSTLKEFLNESR